MLENLKISLAVTKLTLKVYLLVLLIVVPPVMIFVLLDLYVWHGSHAQTECGGTKCPLVDIDFE